MERAHIERNRLERERQEAICARMSNEDLGRPLAHGWTVAAALAHLAFWDRRTLTALAEAERGEVPDSWALGSGDWDATNADELDRWLATSPREAVADALAAAAACDTRIESVSADLAQRLIAAGRRRMLDRSIHRAEHLHQIEQALAG